MWPPSLTPEEEKQIAEKERERAKRPKGKVRTYPSLDQRMFCPNCHRAVHSPFKGMNLNQISGTIQISCGSCRNGIVSVKGTAKPPEETTV